MKLAPNLARLLLLGLVYIFVGLGFSRVQAAQFQFFPAPTATPIPSLFWAKQFSPTSAQVTSSFQLPSFADPDVVLMEAGGTAVVVGQYEGRFNLNANNLFLRELHEFNSNILVGYQNPGLFIVRLNAAGVPVLKKDIPLMGSITKVYAALDRDGNIIVLAESYGTISANGSIQAPNGGNDVVLMKLNKDNLSVAWTKTYGGRDRIGYDEIHGLAVDGDGNIIFAAVLQPDPYLIKLDPTGREDFKLPLENSKSTGAYVGPHDISVDSAGNIFVSGRIQGAISFGSKVSNPVGAVDFFVAKFDSKGSCVSLRRFGGTGGYIDQIAGSLQTGIGGDVYLSVNFYGYISSSTYWQLGGSDVTSNVGPYLTPPLTYYPLVLRLNSAMAVSWGRVLGVSESISRPRIHELVIDPYGNLVLSGDWNGSLQLDILNTRPLSTRQQDAFLLTLNRSTGKRQNALFVGGYNNEEGGGLAYDRLTGTYLIAGKFMGHLSIDGVHLQSAFLNPLVIPFVGAREVQDVFLLKRRY